MSRLIGCLRAVWKYQLSDPPPFVWELLKAAIIPVVVAVVGLSIKSAVDTAQDRRAQERREEEARQTRARDEAEILRQITVSPQRNEVARLLAIATRLNIHLLRYRVLQNSKANAGTLQDEEGIKFEEKASFFFYALFRAKLVDFNANGSVVFSRPWLADVFSINANSVVSTLTGGPDFDVQISLKHEAAIYSLFGGPQQPTLFDTIPKLGGSGSGESLPDCEAELQESFGVFCDRLGQMKREDWDELQLAIASLNAAARYSVVTVMPRTYGLYEETTLDEMPHAAPESFRKMLYSLSPKEVETLWFHMYDSRKFYEQSTFN